MKNFKKLAFLCVLFVSISAHSQNFYTIVSGGVTPSNGNPTPNSYCNRLEIGYLYKNFNCGIGVSNNFKGDALLFSIFPTVTVYETGWTSIFVYTGIGTSAKNAKLLYGEVGGGFNIPLIKSKMLLIQPTISISNYDFGVYQSFYSLGLMYILPSKK